MSLLSSPVVIYPLSNQTKQRFSFDIFFTLKFKERLLTAKRWLMVLKIRNKSAIMRISLEILVLPSLKQMAAN